MTGMRVGSITIDTDALKMTGMRDEKGGSDVKDQSKSSQQKKQADEKKKPKSPEQKTIETTLQSNRREQSAESDTSAPGGLLKKI